MTDWCEFLLPAYPQAVQCPWYERVPGSDDE
jgi:hypothetical protein